MDTSINVKNLSKSYGQIQAVDNISFNISKGDVLGFLGPNGAGKSTTMKMLAGFLTPQSGEITIAGHDILKSPIPAQQQMGYLPEGAPAYSDMTPRQFLKFIAQVRKFHGAQCKKQVIKTAEKINLLEVLDQPIDTLSKGYKRRLGIAQAILHDPAILILDEPTDGLDPNQKHEVRALIKEMAGDKTIILSTHLLEEVDALCNRVIIIAGGKIVADETPYNLRCLAPSHNCLQFGLHTNIAIHAKEALKNISNIKNIEILNQNEQTTYFKLTPLAGKTLLSEFSAISRENNWKIRELHVETGRLDEYFRDVTLNQQARN